MKTKNLMDYQFLVLLTILILTSIVISIFIYINFIVISRGIVGVITLHLLLYLGRQVNLDLSIKDVLADTRKEKYIIAAFIIPAVSCWATVQVFEMILFIFKI
jgi:hypothetical protein